MNEAGLEWPTKEDDFFPYASDPHAYWTGYYTSRPSSKGLMRRANQILQAAKQQSSLAWSQCADCQQTKDIMEATEVSANSNPCQS